MYELYKGRFSIDIVDEEVRSDKLKLWDRQSRLMDQGKGKQFNSIEEFREYWRKL